MQSNIVLKLNLNDDIRRVRLNERSFVSLKKQVQEIYSIGDNFSMKYKDDEGDLVTVTSEEELKEAFLSIQNNILHLKITVEKKEEEKGRCGKSRRWRKHCKGMKNKENEEKIDENSEQNKPHFHQENPFSFLDQIKGIAKNFLGQQIGSSPESSFLENFLNSDFCKLEHNHICDGCDVQISGTRFHCTECGDFDFCSDCYETKIKTHPDHKFEEISAMQALKEAIERGELIDSFFVYGSGANDSVLKVEHNAFCDRCEQQIIGLRWKCLDCDDFDFCNSCYVTANGKETIKQHLSTHTFSKIEDPNNHQNFLLEKQQHLQKMREEKERLENERIEKERLENERIEKEKLEKERLEKERIEKERLEKERLEKNTECPFPFRDVLFPLRNSPSEQPKEVHTFEQKLQDLQIMGFADRKSNIAALIKSKGDVELALEHLLNIN